MFCRPLIFSEDRPHVQSMHSQIEMSDSGFFSAQNNKVCDIPFAVYTTLSHLAQALYSPAFIARTCSYDLDSSPIKIKVMLKALI